MTARPEHGTLRAWLAPPRPAGAEFLTGSDRRLQVTEVLVVLTVTLGLSGLRSFVSLVDALAAPEPLASRQVSSGRPLESDSWADLAAQLTGSLQLLAWGSLGLYLLIRMGSGPRGVGLDGRAPGRDVWHSVGLAALIGIPGLGFYLATRALGINLTVVPSVLDGDWWRVPALIVSAAANSWAEEVVIVGYLLTVLRRLGFSENRSLVVAALVRGSYHLYQGFGGGIGNVVMGLVFGRYWQRTGRLWPLVGAHLLIDVVAFVGSALLAGRVPFLPGP